MEDILNDKDTENDIKYDELFPSVKTYLRISHDKLDNEINEILITGRKELIRAGISEDKAFSKLTENINILAKENNLSNFLKSASQLTQ